MKTKNKSFMYTGSLLKHMVQKRNNIELDIIELLIKHENHVRGIAKSLNTSHSAVSRKLNSLKKKRM
ncbi:ArsR family transcriptional regulator [Candidatus Woesearchaeota archaeon]|nr:ArsR family transcriptional regulator [Candidatus Woesearchaeota archaeon]